MKEGPADHDPSLAELRSAWLVVGLRGEFNRIGDFRTRQVADLSVLVIRDGNRFRVIRNLCTHEQQPFTGRHESGNIARLVCPFHAWTFDRAGIYQPGLAIGNRMPLVAVSDRNLESFEVQVCDGVIWASIGPTEQPAPSLEVPRLTRAPYGALAAPVRLTVDRSWTDLRAHLAIAPSTVIVPPNSAVHRPSTDATACVLLTVHPLGPRRCEVMAWMREDDPIRRRRILTSLLAHCSSLYSTV